MHMCTSHVYGMCMACTGDGGVARELQGRHRRRRDLPPGRHLQQVRPAAARGRDQGVTPHIKSSRLVIQYVKHSYKHSALGLSTTAYTVARPRVAYGAESILGLVLLCMFGWYVYSRSRVHRGTSRNRIAVADLTYMTAVSYISCNHTYAYAQTRTYAHAR